MDKLIQALQIFLKYGNPQWPTHCEHDVLLIMGYQEDEISEEDKKTLYDLGFSWNAEYDSFASYRYGSA
jgi:hypothetical protein